MKSSLYCIAKVFDKPGCYAYILKNENQSRCLPTVLQELCKENVQIVLLDSPGMYPEYKPYRMVDDMKAYIDLVSGME